MSDLTREQILAMPAGPEIDALIAERVMGWHLGGLNYWLNEYDRIEAHLTSWCLSSDGKRMLTVIENRRQAGWWYELTLETEGHGALFEPWDHQCSELRANGACRHQHFGIADRLPLAVCRAALLTTLEGE